MVSVEILLLYEFCIFMLMLLKKVHLLIYLLLSLKNLPLLKELAIYIYIAKVQTQQQQQNQAWYI